MSLLASTRVSVVYRIYEHRKPPPGCPCTQPWYRESVDPAEFKKRKAMSLMRLRRSVFAFRKYCSGCVVFFSGRDFTAITEQSA